MEPLQEFIKFAWLKDILIMFWDSLFDWPIGTLIGVIFFGGIAALLYAILWPAIDSYFLKEEEETGIVVSKDDSFTPTPLILNIVTLTPLMFSFGPGTKLNISIWNQILNIDVGAKCFYAVNEKQEVKLHYKRGRFSKAIYLKSISFKPQKK